jgi:hypothetical protein
MSFNEPLSAPQNLTAENRSERSRADDDGSARPLKFKDHIDFVVEPALSLPAGLMTDELRITEFAEFGCTKGVIRTFSGATGDGLVRCPPEFSVGGPALDGRWQLARMPSIWLSRKTRH